MGIVLWIISAVIAIVVVGLFTRGGIEAVVYAIKAFRFTSAPYVATAIITLVVRFVLFIIQGVMSTKTHADNGSGKITGTQSSVKHDANKGE